MGKVVELNSRRSVPHISGNCECVLCGHKWIGVAPTGEPWLECPSCHAQRGHFVHNPRLSELHATCRSCFGQLFFIAEHAGPYCARCGETFEQCKH